MNHIDLALCGEVVNEWGPPKPHLNVWLGDFAGRSLPAIFKPAVEVSPEPLSSEKIKLYGESLMSKLTLNLPMVGKAWWSEEQLAKLIKIDSRLIRPILDRLNRDGYLQTRCIDPNDAGKRLYRYP